MNARFFQQLILQMKDVMNRHLGMITDGGFVISSKEGCISPNDLNCVLSFTEENTDTFTYNGFTYKPVLNMNKVDYIIFIQGDDTLAKNYINILQVSFSGVKSLYDDKHDRVNFIKNIILDNILPSDIYLKAKELHLDSEVNRVVYLIRFHNHNSDAVPFEIIQNMFPDKSRDYVISVGENDIVLVKELKTAQETKSIEANAKSIVDTVSGEFYLKVTVGIGSVVSSIKELAHSFKDAQVALEVGKVFDTEKTTINYESLGIARLIYQLPTTLCEMFLSEVFRRGSLESLDRETLMTIQAFFDNNLNVSETSRKLFVHRNTLVYRLEKIKKLTGLDLREFDHAITFKVALMVKKYVISKPTIY